MRVQVNLSFEMVEKVDKYAKMMGVSRSALCSMLVGQGILGYDKATDLINILGDSLLNAENVDLGHVLNGYKDK